MVLVHEGKFFTKGFHVTNEKGMLEPESHHFAIPKMK